MQFSIDEKYKTQKVPIVVEFEGKTYKGEGVPIRPSCREGVCFELNITLNNEDLGTIHRTKNGWIMDHIKDQKFVDAIGDQLMLWYE